MSKVHDKVEKAVNRDSVECKRLGISASEELLTRASACGDLARARTFEGHYVRILYTEKDKQERDEGLGKYALKYTALAPSFIHPALRQGVEKAVKKATK